MVIHDRIKNPLSGRYYESYPKIGEPNVYSRIRYGDVGDTTVEQIHIRQALDATRKTRVITSDTQAQFAPRSYVLLADGLYQISTLHRTLINPRALQLRWRTAMSLVAVENPLSLKV